MYTSTCLFIHASVLKQHNESDWHRSSVNSAFGFTHPKDAQYIIKMSSVSQNMKPNVLETKSYVYIMHLRKALLYNNSTVWVNVAESGQTGDPDRKQ